MNIGQMIKIERKKKSIKQDELANGICSPSYLSKIERGSATPSEEVQHLLLQRLNIPLEKVQQQPSPDVLIQFKERFGQVINARDQHAADLLRQEVHSFLTANKSHPNTISLLLIETRLMLPASSDPTENLAVLNSLQRELSPIQQFHLLLIQGIIAYNDNRFTDAQKFYTKAHILSKQHRMEDWEMAELHYMLSLSAISEYQYMLAMEHIEKALAYFKQKQSYYYCFIYCNVLANKLTEESQYKLATAYFEQAFHYHLKHKQVDNWEELT